MTRHRWKRKKSSLLLHLLNLDFRGGLRTQGGCGSEEESGDEDTEEDGSRAGEGDRGIVEDQVEAFASITIATAVYEFC
jgi:hypothetical protein